MFLPPFTLILSLGLFSLVDAGSVNKGQPCNITSNRLQVGTYQFYTNCDTHTYCSSSTGTCELKGCRINAYPFGYRQDDPHLPDMCPKGQFCPDEEDACQSLLAVGSPCQLNRDDQCEPPPNWQQLADTTHRGLNHNGSVCLNNVCMWANATAGSSCTVENTAYIAYGSNSQEFIDIVSRGNCQPGLYCDSQQVKCLTAKNLAESCSADKECLSYNCLSSGQCGVPADSPNHLGVWVYVIVAIGIFGGMIGTLVGLFIMHRRQRDTERERRVQYWREQNAFRQNIMQMRETACASLLSLPNHKKSMDTTVESATMPMLQNAAPRGRNMNHYVNDDDGSVEYENPAVMQPTDQIYGNRF